MDVKRTMIGWTLLALLAAVMAVPHPECLGAEKETIKLVMLGDSVILSSRAPAGKKLPDCVSTTLNKLSKGKPSWNVVNAGVGSETAEKALKRVKQVMDKEKPNFVAIAYGLNDTGKKDPEWFKNNLSSMIETIKKHPSSPQIILVTATPFVDNKHSWGNQGFFKDYGGLDLYLDLEINAVTRKLAQENGLPLCDMHRHFLQAPKYSDMMLGDGVHPSPEGNEYAGVYLGRCMFIFYSAKGNKKASAARTEEKIKTLAENVRKDSAGATGAKRRRFEKTLESAWRSCPYLPDTVVVLDELAKAARQEK